MRVESDLYPVGTWRVAITLVAIHTLHTSTVRVCVMRCNVRIGVSGEAKQAAQASMPLVMRARACGFETELSRTR